MDQTDSDASQKEIIGDENAFEKSLHPKFCPHRDERWFIVTD